MRVSVKEKESIFVSCMHVIMCMCVGDGGGGGDLRCAGILTKRQTRVNECSDVVYRSLQPFIQ